MHISAQTKHVVHLTNEQQEEIKLLLSKGKTSARTITRARVLMLTHQGKTDKEIREILGLAKTTPYDIRKRFTGTGLKRALYDNPHPGKVRKLSGAQEAEVIAITCTKAPKGYVRWTMDLLTEAVNKQLDISIGRTAIWHVLLRSEDKPWLKKNVVYTGTDT